MIRSVAVMMLCMGFAGCQSEPEWRDLRNRSPDCILVIFTADASVGDIQQAVKTTTTVPHDSRGDSLRSGVVAVLKHDVGKRRGYEVCFGKSASPQEKTLVVDGLKRSEVVVEIIDNEQQIRALK